MELSRELFNTKPVKQLKLGACKISGASNKPIGLPILTLQSK